jgi:hypothetical protein
VKKPTVAKNPSARSNPTPRFRNPFSRFLSTDTVISIAIACLTLVVYVLTLSPSIGPEDAGELAAAAHTLGITHPTGYPLFSLLGRAFSMLPLGDLRVIVKMNLLGALLCAAAVGVGYRLFLVLLHATGFQAPSRTKTGPQETSTPHPLVRLAAATGILVLAFSRVVWANAVNIEVYALHLLLIELVILLFVFSIQAYQDKRADAERLWLLFAYVTGLSFANHMMTVLLLPAFAVLYFTTHGAGKAAWLKIARVLPLFFLALSAYAYLPLRAATQPLMNWGDTATLSRLLSHVSGAQYRERMFSSTAVAQKKFVEFFVEFPIDFGYLPLLLVVAGLVLLARTHRTHRRLFLFTVLIFVTGVFYAINYDFEDPNFRLNAHLMAAFWVAWAVYAIGEWVLRRAMAKGRTSRAILAPLCAGCLLLVVAPLAFNYKTMDESDNYSVEDFVRNGIESVDRDAVILSGTFVEFSFAAWYLQHVEGVRPDVLIADYSLLGLSWHYLALERARPALALETREGIRSNLETQDETSASVSASNAAASGNQKRQPPGDADSPEHIALIRAFVETWYRFSPVYTVGMTPPGAIGNFYDVPEGVINHLYAQLPAAQPIHFFNFRPLPNKDTRHVHNVRGAYAEAYYNQALYRALILSDLAGAETLLLRALEIRNDFTEARTLLGQLRAPSPGPYP